MSGTSSYVCEDCGESFEKPQPYAAHRRGEQQKISDEALLEDLRRLASELGEPPSSNQVDEQGEYGTTTYERFGRWNDALREAGLEPKQEWKIPTEELIAELQSVAHEIGRTPRKDDFIQHGKWDEKVYRTRFGSWNDALSKAGFSPNARHRIPKEELLDEIRELEEFLGNPPCKMAMKHLGKFSERPYYRNFDSWYDALREAGFDPSSVLKHERFRGYGQGWNEEKKNCVRKRDSYTCQDPGCETTQEEHLKEFGFSLHVHHIQRPSEFANKSEANELDNLVTLCCRHHSKWEQLTPLRPDSRSSS